MLLCSYSVSDYLMILITKSLISTVKSIQYNKKCILCVLSFSYIVSSIKFSCYFIDNVLLIPMHKCLNSYYSAFHCNWHGTKPEHNMLNFFRLFLPALPKKLPIILILLSYISYLSFPCHFYAILFQVLTSRETWTWYIILL